MDAEKLQEMLTVLHSKEEIQPEVINEYSQIITTFQMSSEGFLWLTENFFNFESPELIELAMSTFRLWISTNWESIPSTVIDPLRSILFQNARPYTDHPSISSLQVASQVGLFFNLYPEIWPTFWQDLFTLNEKIITSFLQGLLSSQDDRLNQGIFQPQIDNSEEIVTSYLIDKITKGQEEAYSIITQMLSFGFIDPTSILNSPIVGIIQSTLTETTQEIISQYSPESEEPFELINKVDAAIKLVNSIACSPIDPELLNNFLLELKIIDIMMAIFQNECFTSIMASASSLIAACANFFDGTPAAPEYYQLSLLMLQHPLIDVISPIVTFVENFTIQSSSSDTAQQSFMSLLSVLKNYFSSLVNTEPDFMTNETMGELDQNASDLLKSITNILNKYEGLLDAYLSPLIQKQNELNASSGGLALEPLELAALFNLLIDVVQNHQTFETRNELCSAFFVPLITAINPPYEDLQVYYLVTAYMTMISNIAEQFNSPLPYEQTNYPPIEIFQMTFQQVFANLPYPYSEFQKIKFKTIANNFTSRSVRLFKKYLGVSSEFVINLFKTGDFEVIEASIKLLAKFESAEQIAVLQECMEILNGFLSASEDQKRMFKLMLELIEKQKSNDSNKDQQLRPVLMMYMEKLLPVAASDGELMSKYLDVIVTVFSGDGISLFASLIENAALNHIESIQKCCKVCVKYAQLVSSFEWVAPIVLKIWESASHVIQSVSEWNDRSEEARQGIQLLIDFFSMIADKNLSIYFAPEMNQNLLQFIGEIFPLLIKIDTSKVPLGKSIVYLTNLTKVENGVQLYVPGLIQAFLPLTFQVIQDESFNNDALWNSIIVPIAQFHQSLAMADTQTTMAQITQIWGTFSQSQESNELLSSYLAIIQSDHLNKHRAVIWEIFNKLHGLMYQ